MLMPLNHRCSDCCMLVSCGLQTWAVFAGKNQLLGDLLCLGGAVLFAVVSVTQELVVKTFDWVEYLGMVGLFGSVISIVQTYVQMFTHENTYDLSCCFTSGGQVIKC